ncbi:tlde1 domain-containing protein [Pantoea vagans]|uniref:tlde1 domain-containing protein n=1 Tax=Pantoea vagans TaxID=470934 RepID=UPI003FA389CF
MARIAPFRQGCEKMTWVYDVRKRTFTHNGEYKFAAMYAGAVGYKNDPQYESLKNKGPLPRGKYKITGKPFLHPHSGPYTLRLTPYPGNTMFGRSGFLIHGDSREKPGEASNGCIVLAPGFRHKIYESGDWEVNVQ